MRAFWIFCSLICLGLLLPAQQVPCSDTEYHQFDFWVGDWEVFNPDGKKVGENRIERKLGTCMLMENWVGQGPSRGHSFNVYNQSEQRWEQYWVDNTGGVIHFLGDWDAGAGQMKFQAEGKARDGMSVQYRLDFTPQKNGDVRQLWTARKKGAAEWDTLFDGLYRKKSE